MSEYKSIDKDRLKGWLDSGEDFVLLNVLSKESFDAGHIRGSLNVDLRDEDFLEKVEALAPDKDKFVVVYCFTGNTSLESAKILNEAGYSQVYNYEGGTDDWEEADYPLETD
ncbi:MAG: rhodanese-like domain-containing protein [Patescibacteria group bacterium]